MEGRTNAVTDEKGDHTRQYHFTLAVTLSSVVVLTALALFNAHRINTLEERYELYKSLVSASLVREKTELSVQLTEVANTFYDIYDIRQKLKGQERNLATTLSESEQLLGDLRAEWWTHLSLERRM